MSDSTSKDEPKQPEQMDENVSPTDRKPIINMGQLLMGRKKVPKQPNFVGKNKDEQKIDCTPANIKRLQVNKWFNSPTDNLFSPCTRRLYNIKNHHPVHLIDEIRQEEDQASAENNSNQ